MVRKDKIYHLVVSTTQLKLLKSSIRFMRKEGIYTEQVDLIAKELLKSLLYDIEEVKFYKKEIKKIFGNFN